MKVLQHCKMSRCLIISAIINLALSSSALAVQWTIAQASAVDSVTQHSLGEFTAAVKQSTQGTLILASGKVGAMGTDKILSELGAGRIALAILPMAALESLDPVLAMDRIPYLASNYVDAAKLWKVLSPHTHDMLKARGITLLYAVPSSPLAPLALKSLTQMSSWRASTISGNAPAIAGLAKAVGARVVAPAPPRVLLGKGTAQIVFQSASASVQDKAWEYATHYLRAPAWFPKQLVLLSSRQLASLPARQRDALLDAADAAQVQAWPLSKQITKDSEQKIRDFGIRTRSPEVNTLIQLEAVGRELLFQWSDSADEKGAELVEKYYAIR